MVLGFNGVFFFRTAATFRVPVPAPFPFFPFLFPRLKNSLSILMIFFVLGVLVVLGVSGELIFVCQGSIVVLSLRRCVNNIHQQNFFEY
jgi:hypothetical protein